MRDREKFRGKNPVPEQNQVQIQNPGVPVRMIDGTPCLRFQLQAKFQQTGCFDG